MNRGWLVEARVVFLLLVCGLAPAGALWAEVNNNEILASNRVVIQDDDGESSDYVELYNDGLAPVDLAGYGLSDDPSSPFQWVFEEAVIEPGQYLLVWCSGKNRITTPTTSTTTVGGTNVASRGVARQSSECCSTAARAATDGSLGSFMHTHDAQDPNEPNAGSQSVPTICDPYLGVACPHFWEVEFSQAEEVSRVVMHNRQNCCGDRLRDITVSIRDSEGTVMFESDLLNPENHMGSPDMIDLDVTQLAGGPVTGSSVRIDRKPDPDLSGATSPPHPAEERVLQMGEVEIFTGGITTTTGGSFAPTLISLSDEWKYLTASPQTSGPSASWTDPGFNDASWDEGLPGFGYGDGDDTTVIDNDEHGILAVFLRRKFTVDPAEDLEQLLLRINYDDGFVCYLNGVPVASKNYPQEDPVTFGSVATSSHDAELAELFNLTEQIGLLVPGENTLAIAVLNRSEDSSDLSMLPELGTATPAYHTNFKLSSAGERLVLTRPNGTLEDEITFPDQEFDIAFARVPDVTGSFAYDIAPSPAAPNSGTGFPLPPVVQDTKFSVNRGFFESSFDVEITSATNEAQIRYTTDGTTPTSTKGLLYSEAIRISETTTLRAAAFAEGLRPSNVDTQTYIFLDEIVRQSRSATLALGFPGSWSGVSADYGMDPDVIGFTSPDDYGGKYSATVKDDLLSIPTMSIVADMDDLFGSGGIYSNPTQRGRAWEVPASMEYFTPDGSESFQANAGIRIHGGAFRSHGLTKKHSLRFIFRGVYGPTRLRYPFFGPDAAQDFNVIVLRAFANDGYQWDGSAHHPTFCRDTYAMETLQEMGSVAPHGKFVHLYINRAYWGLYNPVERPDHNFSASYFGDEPEDWDAISNSEASNGDLAAWNELSRRSSGLSSNASYFAVQGKNADGTVNPDLTNSLDLDNYINYMIMNQWIGNLDWPHKNYWVGRSRVANEGFKFYPWDSEWALGWIWNHQDVRCPYDRTGINEGTAKFYSAARANAEFRITYADYIHRNFFNGGPMYVDPNNPDWDPANPGGNVPAARWKDVADRVDRAVVAETARWGDQHFNVPFTHDETWVPKQEEMLHVYFPCRSLEVMDQFRSANLYPDVVAPTFTRPGGEIDTPVSLGISAPLGDVYVSIDGVDPRQIGGGVSQTAILVDSSGGASGVSTLLTEGADVRILVPGPEHAALGLDWTEFNFDDSQWDSGTSGVGFDEGSVDLYSAHFNTNITALMYRQNPTVYLRFEFVAEDPGAVTFLSLRMKYDDGYVAYLNGRRIAAKNAPGNLAWDVRSSSGHPDTQALEFESVDISQHTGALRTGLNILAIHGLNTSVNGNDFLMVPEITTAAGGASITLDETTHVMSRVRLNGEWSALNEATFLDIPSLRVTEIMYHTTVDGPREGDFEFFELKNIGDEPVELDGMKLEGGIDFDFSTSTISTVPAGAYILLVNDEVSFNLLYPGLDAQIAGEYQGQLNNAGERIILKGPRDEPIHDFTYVDTWYPNTDGLGRSLVIVDDTAKRESWALESSWQESSVAGGSPGRSGEDVVTGGLQLPGDADQDGLLDLGDVMRLLFGLYGQVEISPPCDGANLADGANVTLLDVNSDTMVDIQDAVDVLLYLFADGAAPAQGTGCTRIEGCPVACGF